MTGFRFFSVLAGVSRKIAMIPAVIPIVVVGRFCTRGFVYVSNDGSEFGDILECFNQMGLTSCESRSEGAVGGR